MPFFILEENLDKAYEIIVIGRVQGVGFRFFTQRKARLYGIKGYVKNQVNGNVKIIAVGETDKLKRFIKKIKIGPDFSWVADTRISELSNYSEYNEFSIKR